MISPFLPYQYFWSGILACQSLIYQVTNGFANEMNVPNLTNARLFGMAVMNHKDSPTLAPYECNEWRMTGHYFSDFCMKSNHFWPVVPNHGYCLMPLLMMTNAIDIVMLIAAFFSDDSSILIFSTDLCDFYPTVQYLLVKLQLPNVIYIPVMMTSSNGNIFALLALCAGNSPVNGEFPAQRAVTRSFDLLFGPRLKKWLSKQSPSWWFETPSRSSWRHCNVHSSMSSLAYVFQWTDPSSVSLMHQAITWTKGDLWLVGPLTTTYMKFKGQFRIQTVMSSVKCRLFWLLLGVFNHRIGAWA